MATGSGAAYLQGWAAATIAGGKITRPCTYPPPQPRIVDDTHGCNPYTLGQNRICGAVRGGGGAAPRTRIPRPPYRSLGILLSIDHTPNSVILRPRPASPARSTPSAGRRTLRRTPPRPGAEAAEARRTHLVHSGRRKGGNAQASGVS